MNSKYLLSTFVLVVCIAVAAITSAESEAETSKDVKVVSFIPVANLGDFIVERLDLSTFRNSFGPRREPGQRHFEGFGLMPTLITDEAVEFDTEEWLYAVRIIRRTDENADGLMDLVVSFVDESKIGAYRRSESLLLTRFENNGNLIALAFTPDK